MRVTTTMARYHEAASAIAFDAFVGLGVEEERAMFREKNIEK